MKKASTKRKYKYIINNNNKKGNIKSEMSNFVSALSVIKESDAVISHMLGFSQNTRR